MLMDFINQNILFIFVVVISVFGLFWLLFMGLVGNSLFLGEVMLLINWEDVYIVDVCEVDEFVSGYLFEVKNILVSKLVDCVVELERFKDKLIILCCVLGMCFGKVSNELKKQGFSKFYNLVGGVDVWVGVGYLVKKGIWNK